MRFYSIYPSSLICRVLKCSFKCNGLNTPAKHTRTHACTHTIYVQGHITQIVTGVKIKYVLHIYTCRIHCSCWKQTAKVLFTPKTICYRQINNVVTPKCQQQNFETKTHNETNWIRNGKCAVVSSDTSV